MFHHGDPFFYAFDLLWLNGEDLRGLPLVERKKHLKNLVARERIYTDRQRILFLGHRERNGFQKALRTRPGGNRREVEGREIPRGQQAVVVGEDQEPDVLADGRSGGFVRAPGLGYR
jgi:hypothetical protein